MKTQRERDYRDINVDYWFLRYSGFSFVGAMEAMDIVYKDVSYDVIVRELSLNPI